MDNLTGYHDKLCELSSQIVEHGWGEGKFSVVSMKDNSVKIEIHCGKSFVFFVKKEIEIDENKLL